MGGACIRRKYRTDICLPVKKFDALSTLVPLCPESYGRVLRCFRPGGTNLPSFHDRPVFQIGIRAFLHDQSPVFLRILTEKSCEKGSESARGAIRDAFFPGT